MKESKRHYHFFAREANFENRDAKALLKNYTRSVEWILSKYPYQWFNFYDFWEDLK
jgi:predicted LPLAT superfamily acyltransferase